MEDQNITSYRQALRALWDLRSVKPEEAASGNYRTWKVLWDAQLNAVEMTRLDVTAYGGIELAGKVLFDERQAWKEEQSND